MWLRSRTRQPMTNGLARLPIGPFVKNETVSVQFSYVAPYAP